MSGAFVVFFLFMFFLWIFVSVAVGNYAEKKGYSKLGFILISLFISPIIAFIVALVLPVSTEVRTENSLNANEVKKCMYCAELVKVEAIICKHCGKDLPAQEKISVEKTSKETKVSSGDLLGEMFQES